MRVDEHKAWKTLEPLGAPEYIRWHLRRIVTCIGHCADHIRLPQSAKILDLGHDPYVGLLMAPIGGRLVGNLGPEIAPQTPPFVSWDLVQFDFHKGLPFADGTFDAVTMLEVLEHVRDDARGFLSEVRRVLKPSGFLYIGTPNAVAWEKIVRSLRQAQIYDTLPFSMNYGPRHGMSHTYEFGAYELRELLKSCGYQTVSLKTWNPYSLDPRGPRQAILRSLFTVALALTGHVREAALMWYRRGHQLSVVCRAQAG